VGVDQTIETMLVYPKKAQTASRWRCRTYTVSKPQHIRMVDLNFGSKDRNLRNPSSKDKNSSEENQLANHSLLPMMANPLSI